MTEREILFRGQTRRNNDCAKMPSSNWVYGGIFIPNDKCNYAIIIAQQESAVEKHSVYGDTVGQYTGLTDKNGKKIFEGDIVRAFTRFSEIYVSPVAYHDGTFWFKNWSWTKFLFKFEKIEVIGNIHDNPELLKVW